LALKLYIIRQSSGRCGEIKAKTESRRVVAQVGRVAVKWQNIYVASIGHKFKLPQGGRGEGRRGKRGKEEKGKVRASMRSKNWSHHLSIQNAHVNSLNHVTLKSSFAYKPM
jgi:hypothetical protein